MHRTRLAGNLRTFKGKIQENWGVLTHQRASVLTGKMNQVIGRILSLFGRVVR
jgi:uncharacterized protein YjbJ (UPF0337 family)